MKELTLETMEEVIKYEENARLHEKKIIV